jgi:hypothetical protein
LIEIFANKQITFTVIESFPKEKTSILGVAEVSLYRAFLLYFVPKLGEDSIPECPLSFQQVLPIAYSNPKMLTQNQEAPCISIQVSLNRPIIPVSKLRGGIFASLNLDDLYPVPEDWSLREGNEKDINSSSLRLIKIYTATI